MNGNVAVIINMRAQMKENGFNKKQQQVIRQMTKTYRHNKSNQHQHKKINWHLVDQEQIPWKWGMGKYFNMDIEIKKNQWQY